MSTTETGSGGIPVRAPTPEPHRHPLVVELAPWGWRFVVDHEASSVLLLHRRGLWLEIDREWWENVGQPNPRPLPGVLALARALQDHLSAGHVGEHTCTLDTDADTALLVAR